MKKFLFFVCIISFFCSCNEESVEDCKESIITDELFVEYLTVREEFNIQIGKRVDFSSDEYKAIVADFLEVRACLYSKFPELKADPELFRELLQLSDKGTLKSVPGDCNILFDTCMLAAANTTVWETHWFELVDNDNDGHWDGYELRTETETIVFVSAEDACECETLTAICFCDRFGQIDLNFCFEGICLGVQP